MARYILLLLLVVTLFFVSMTYVLGFLRRLTGTGPGKADRRRSASDTPGDERASVDVHRRDGKR
ncbi:MAG: hypothetical protein ACKOAX_02725 [Candidatus Kapaibacterium sp.]